MQNFKPPVIWCTIWIICGGNSAAGHEVWIWVWIWVWVLSLNLGVWIWIWIWIWHVQWVTWHSMATLWRCGNLAVAMCQKAHQPSQTTHNPCHVLCINNLHIAKSGFKYLNNIAAVHASKNLYQVRTRCEDKFEDSVTESSYFWSSYFQS